jgi:hypothetical protein
MSHAKTEDLKSAQRATYEKPFRITCQAGKLWIGALNALLLAWDAAGGLIGACGALI